MQLGPLARASGYSFEFINTLDSTNSEAMRRINAAGANLPPSRQWIAAGQQSAGRGRLGRPWASEPGNLFASLLLAGEADPAQAAQLGFVTGVALVEALTPFLPAAKMPLLKWPNDIVCDGAKIAGILLEGSIIPRGSFACVIGCGANCTSHPDNTSYAATDLATLGAEVSPAQLFSGLSDRFAHWFDIWRDAGGFARVRENWLRHAAHIGQTIRVAQSGEAVEGVFETLDEGGRLILRCNGGLRVIDTGDVMLSSVNTSEQAGQKS